MDGKNTLRKYLGLLLIGFLHYPADAQLNLRFNNKTIGPNNGNSNQRSQSPSKLESKSGPMSEPQPDSRTNDAATQDSRVAQIIFANAEYGTFDEAKAQAVNQVKDGDHLWMYVKFPGPSANYIPVDPDAGIDENGQPIHTLRTAMGPEDASAVWNVWTLRYSRRELNRSELKVNLAPGIPGKNRSSNSLLKTVGEGNPGTWKNTVIVYAIYGENLGVATLTCNVSKSISKYRQMSANWFNIISAGTADENELPAAGKFSDNSIRSQCSSELRQRGLYIDNFYFTSNNWASVSESGKLVARQVEAVFIYKEKSDCLFGTVLVRQNYNPLSGRYGASELKIRKGMPYRCK